MMSVAIQSVSHAIEPAKQGAKRHYGSHPYFTKRAWNVVQAYVQRFSAPGETVLDPFGGSGVTAVESLVLRRRAVYVDISEWACFLARQTAVAPVDLNGVRSAFGQVEDAARGFIEHLMKTSERELRERPVADWYPRAVPLPGNSDVSTVEELFTPRMLHGLAKLRTAILDVGDRPARELLLLAFSATLARINRTFLSTAGRAKSRGGSAIFSIYRYKVAREPVELPLWEQFSRRVSRLIEAKRETNRLIGGFFVDGETARFIHGSATRLGEYVEPETVDYVYTDPPYGAHISYLDLSTMWAAWLGFDIGLHDRAEEVIEGGQLRKPRDVYRRLLADSVRQMAITLKPGRCMSVVFAHRDTAYWEMLVDACSDAGLAYLNTVVQPVGVVWSMHKKKNPLRVLSGELVLNFRKSAQRTHRRIRQSTEDPQAVVLRTCERAIVGRIGCTTEELHHVVVPVLLEAGLLATFSQAHGDLTPVLSEHFVFHRESGKWHLKWGEPLSARLSARSVMAYHLVRVLSDAATAARPLTEPQILKQVQRRLDGTATVDPDVIHETLLECADSPDGRHWRIRQQDGQTEFVFVP